MKRFILMVNLLTSVHVFANSCMRHNNGDDYINVRYTIWNESEYEIGLRFDEATHGENPDYDQYLLPHSSPVIEYGCSHGFFTGYETKAALLMRDLNSKTYINLAYLYIQNPFSGHGFFSYKNQGVNPPQCSCKVRVANFSDEYHENDEDYFDCLDFKEPLKKSMQIVIGCK